MTTIAPSLLAELITVQASIRPHSIALRCGAKTLDYASLNERVNQLAWAISGIGGVGDRVALLAWNCIEFVEMIYGVPAAGRILVPLNARLAPAELIYQLQHAGVSTLIADPELLTPLMAYPDFPKGLNIIRLNDDYRRWRDCAPPITLPACAATDPVWILFTSGSTGRPKGAVLTHASLMAGLKSAALGRPVVPDDRYYYAFPLFHITVHNLLLQHQYGAEVILAKSFDAADTLRACRELGITTLSLAPTMIAMLLQEPDFSPADLAKVRTIGYGASAMPLALLQRLLRDTSVGLSQSYGMTELSGSIAYLTVDDHRMAAVNASRLLQSVGKPLATAEVKLLDEKDREVATGGSGEIAVQARQCMSGYWDDRDNTARVLVDGWLRTGDVGRFDEDGYLYLVDRKKDMILSGGENIASREVEEVLHRHPDVKDCAVIGLPDPKWGERLSAILVIAGEISDQELERYCREHLAGYKTPKHWVRVQALPLNASGKVDKPLLRRQFAKAAF